LVEVRTERRQAARKPVSPSVECQTDFPYKYMLSSSSPKDDSGLIESCDVGSTRYTQTVSVLEVERSNDTLVSNPHPDIIQDVLSNKVKKRKTKLASYQKGVILEKSGLKNVFGLYRSPDSIVLICDIDALTNNVDELKKMVIRLGVRSSDWALTARKTREQLRLSTGPNKYI
jgi:hypothetical protein